MVGKTLGHYEILEPLGKGGMGEVYRARDTKLDRDVAIKVLPEGFANDPDRLARFDREAKLLAALSHANIVVVHSIEKEEGVHFLTMELVEGRTLGSLIPPNGLPLDSFFDIAIQLADAISAAHGRGVTHRDLKPSNVMVAEHRRVKVLDFGLAKLTEPEGIDGDSTKLRTESLTGQGTVLGTVAYMSPEQAEGKVVDHRTDIFTLGVLLHQIATGNAPFQGDTAASLISSILRDTPPPVHELNAELPRHLGRIVKTCLEKDPERRLQSAKDLRNALEQLKDELSSGEILAAGRASSTVTATPGAAVSAAKTRMSFRERFAWAAVAILVIALGTMGYLMLRQPPAPRTLRIATGGVAGVYYPLGMGISRIVAREMSDVSIEVVNTDGSLENARLLDRGDVDLAFVQNDIAFLAVMTDEILGHRSSNIAGLAALYDETVQIIVRVDAGIATVEDLRGKRVSTGMPQSGSRMTTGNLLERFGLTESDYQAQFMGIVDAQAALRDGSLDAAIVWRAVPSPYVQELFMDGGFDFVSIPPEIAEGVRAAQPFFTPTTVLPLTYPNQNEPVDTLAVKALLVASPQLDEALVESLLNAIFGNIPDLIASHVRASDISFDTAFGLENGMPIEMHPGAERFRAAFGEGR